MNYINKNYLTYETILSQGKGKVTKNLEIYFTLLVDNIIKLNNIYDYEQRNDMMQTAYLNLYKNYQNFNSKKYDSPFNYFTEIIKRAFAESFNLTNKIKYNNRLVTINIEKITF